MVGSGGARGGVGLLGGYLGNEQKYRIILGFFGFHFDV